MPAADPVHPVPPLRANPADGAAVIDISRRHAGTHTRRGRWDPVSQPPGPHPGPTPPTPRGDDLARRRLADHIETTFNAGRLTLTDDDTAAAYRITLRIIGGILDGALAEGIVDEAQRHELGDLIAGLETAPDLV